MSFGSDFLKSSDLFPARSAGEPWGDRRVTVDFSGGPYTLSGLRSDQVEALRDHFGSDYVQTGLAGGSIEIRVYRAGENDFRNFPLDGWDYHLDLDYHARSIRIAGLRFMGLLEWRPELAGAVWTPALDPSRFCEVSENFLRVAAQYRVLEAGGLLVHSAALVIDGVAYLFPGRSGAGKSTLSRLAAERSWQILSDELNALSVREGTTYVQQVPFAGDFGRTIRSEESFPLAGIFHLRQAAEDTLEPLSAPQAFGVMLSCSPFVNLDPERNVQAQSVLESIVSRQSCYTLRFSMGGRLAALDALASKASVATL